MSFTTTYEIYITKPIQSLTMLIWYGWGPSPVLTLPSSLCRCMLYWKRHHHPWLCHPKVYRQPTSIWVFAFSDKSFTHNNQQRVPAKACQVQTKQIHTRELNQGPWDLQHSTLTTGLQQLVEVGCSNPTDTMLLLFCHLCSPAPPLLLGQLHWSLTITQKLFLALTQFVMWKCEQLNANN